MVIMCMKIHDKDGALFSHEETNWLQLWFTNEEMY